MNEPTIYSILRGARLRTERRAEDVAAALGITRQTLGQWESGNGSPRVEVLSVWLDAVQATPEERSRVAALVLGEVPR